MLDRWVTEVSEALGIAEPVDVEKLLNVARVVAHRVERKAAPVTTYLMGMSAANARGGGAAAVDAADTVVELARSWSATDAE